MGEAPFAQQNKTAFLLYRYKVFQFIGVDYGTKVVLLCVICRKFNFCNINPIQTGLFEQLED